MRNEAILDPTNGKTLTCPPGTISDLMFLKSCQIDPWSSLGMITYVIGECPWRDHGHQKQCDRDRHQWDGPEVSREGKTHRTCSKCGDIDWDAHEEPEF